MKLDPVYLVAPDPAPAPTVARRTFVFGMLGGLAAGVGLGFFAGAFRSGAPAPTGDTPASAGLAWALRLQDGPLGGLVQHRRSFLIVFAEERDPRLLHGVERLAVAVVEDDPAVAESRATLAATLAADIEATPVAAPLLRYVPALRRVR